MEIRQKKFCTVRLVKTNAEKYNQYENNPTHSHDLTPDKLCDTMDLIHFHLYDIPFDMNI